MKPIKVRDVGPDQQESIPDRLLRIAREAGYEPTGCTQEGAYCVMSFAPPEGRQRGARVRFAEAVDDATIAEVLKCVGPNNQPKAVRARKAASELKPLWGLVPKATDKRATVPCTELGEEPLFGLPTEKPGRLSASVRTVMVNEIIAAQCAAGGVDTPGTRAEAERWCAMLAGCVCEGMRATTGLSRHRLAKRDRCRSAGIDPRSGRLYECSVPRGIPLGRP